MNDAQESGGSGPPEADRDDHPRVTPLQVVASTVAAAFGVQSSRNRARDFAAGKPVHFILAGVAFTVLFVLGMILLVRLVLTAAA
jgi:hypothetical protein